MTETSVLVANPTSDDVGSILTVENYLSAPEPTAPVRLDFYASHIAKHPQYPTPSWDISTIGYTPDHYDPSSTDGFTSPEPSSSDWTPPKQPFSTPDVMSQPKARYCVPEDTSETNSPIDSTMTTDRVGGDDASITSPSSHSDSRARRLSQRERNRIAASKCRRKSKKQEQELRQKERELATQHQVLLANIMMLKEEIFGLKSEILRHGSCNCEIIDNYIETSAHNLPTKEKAPSD